MCTQAINSSTFELSQGDMTDRAGQLSHLQLFHFAAFGWLPLFFKNFG